MVKLCNSAVIPLAYRLNPTGELIQESRDRIDKAIDIFEECGMDFLVLNSRVSVVEYPDGNIEYTFYPPFYEKMKEYAMMKGFPEERILCETYSMDTVGGAYFIKEVVLKPRNIREILVITSDYHVPRTSDIFRKILGPFYSMEFVGVESGKDCHKLLSEETKLGVFLEQFSSVRAGYGKEIEERLYDSHGLYSSVPEDERLYFYGKRKK